MIQTIGRVACYCRLSREEQGKNSEIFDDKYKELISKIKNQIDGKVGKRV